jgi:hypothetical protein
MMSFYGFLCGWVTEILFFWGVLGGQEREIFSSLSLFLLPGHYQKTSESHFPAHKSSETF